MLNGHLNLSCTFPSHAYNFTTFIHQFKHFFFIHTIFRELQLQHNPTNDSNDEIALKKVVIYLSLGSLTQYMTTDSILLKKILYGSKGQSLAKEPKKTTKKPKIKTNIENS